MPRLIATALATLAVAATAAPAGAAVFTADAYDNEMGLTAPLGSTKGSFIDASQVYGSAAVARGGGGAP
jgi:hypothetical protein